MLLAQKAAARHGFSLWGGRQTTIAWQGPPPRLELWLCSAEDDCAIVEYDESEWTYVQTRADGGLGKAYPSYGEELHYGFDDAAAAARFERSLRNAGARISGTWQAGASFSCRTAYATADCAYRVSPRE
ncbi:hypothetical protein H0E84_12430 [Luteimonas sp. SJ-92]|uniref:Uncharacterized protein n=1 Tax=Luteimonas salinisoli TaxID=2752307 RepID=A0A853JFC7_9GAMM|nr:hypothetical protein [Luteimonas salinisoli]NZA27188.1 hypothetical protein [Luteimonas salinisoli]